MKMNYVPPNRTSFLPTNQLAPDVPLATLPAFQSLEPINQREAFAQNVLSEGVDSSPTRGGWGEGLARMGKALIGGILQNKANRAMETAKTGNRQYVLDAFESGDLGKLITSDDPIAQRLGSALIEQKMKQKSGSYRDVDGVKVWQDNQGGAPTVISRPANPLIHEGMISYDRGETWAKIPDYVENAKALADAKRAPKTAKPDDSGKMPWERKW